MKILQLPQCDQLLDDNSMYHRQNHQYIYPYHPKQNQGENFQRQGSIQLLKQQTVRVESKQTKFQVENTQKQTCRKNCHRQHLRHSNFLFQSWIKICIQIFLLTHALVLVESNSIFMTAASSNQSVGTQSNYTIFFNRSQNALGQSITPSNLEASYIITVLFDSSYTLTTSASVSVGSFTINQTAPSINIYLTQQISQFSITSITNPIVSQTSLRITLNFYSGSSPLTVVDTCSASIVFQPLNLASSSIGYQFVPGSVSTTSNLSISLIPYQWSSSKMALKINFLTYWQRNLLNVSSNQVLSSMSYCQPTCTISNMGSFYIVQFNTLSLVSSSITIVIFNILSPPTLQPIDTVTISIIQTTYSSIFQSGTTKISSKQPNSLQVISASTSSIVGVPVTITIVLTTQDLFSSSDSIIIVMATNVSMASQVTYSNILVASCDISIQQNSMITFSNFILVTSSPGQFSGSLTITNISLQESVKPVSNNKISFYRYGYLYDESYFSFSVKQANMTSIDFSLSSIKANQLANLTANINLSVGVKQSDILYCNIDQQISIFSCNVLGCSNCLCTITQANPTQGLFYNSLKISNFGTSSTDITMNIVLLITVRNPIKSNYTVYFTTVDSQNFTKQTGSKIYPATVLSVISSSVFSLTYTSNIVYQPSNFTILLNFSSYLILNGWIQILFDSSITLLDPTNSICLVNNNNGVCNLTVVNGSTLARLSATANTLLYTIVINNVRNPPSTRLFSFQVTVKDASNLSYYSLTSPSYQITTPFQLTPSVTVTNCMNSAPNTIRITFSYLPFNPSNAVIIDDTSALPYQGESYLMKIGYPMIFSSSINLTITNFMSGQPIYFSILVVSSDQIYKYYSFNFTLINCNPSILSINSYLFTGLPEDNGTLNVIFDQVYMSNGASLIPKIKYVTILFSSQYNSQINISSSALSTSQLGPRFFNLTVSGDSPIIINVWGFTNVIGGFMQFSTFTPSLTGQSTNYFISSNKNTIKYNLSSVATCTFPCKFCSSTSSSSCLKCYSSITTQSYYLDVVTNKCVTQSQCSSNTFINSSNSTCVACPSQCLTCTSSTQCQSCFINYYLLNNACLTTCPNGYYPVNPEQVCSPCNSVNNTAHCDNCLTINVCINCLFPYYFNSSAKICVVSCNQNQIVINSTCFSCLSFCSTCQGSVSTCTSCLSGYYLLSNSCLPSCPSPYVPSTTTNVCVNCSTSCLTCTNTPQTCTSCFYPLKLYSSACISNCPSNYYTYTANNSTLQCLICSSQCTTCTSQTYCMTCAINYYFYNNSCLNSCPISTYVRTITSNVSTTLICSACSSFCLRCTISQNCLECTTGYYLTTSTNSSYCVSLCNAGQYLSGTICKNCSNNCITCLNEQICLLCSTPFSLESSECVSNCSFGSTSIIDSIILPSSNSSGSICRACSTLFQYCSTCLSSSCSLCNSGFILTANKSCVVVCPNGYVNISNICSLCNTECKTCANIQNNCTSCNSGFVYYQNLTSNINKCLTSCVPTTFNLSGVCTLCVSPCINCVNSSTTCLSCLSGFFFIRNNDINCVASCPSNSYIFNNQCIYCDSQCSHCDANGCLQCSPQSYKNSGSVIGSKTYYECYNSCPSLLPYAINQTCSKCNQNCKVCNNQSCLQCASGLYGYQSYCLSQCPPGMNPISGICVTIIPSNQTNDASDSSSISNITVPVPFTISSTIVIVVILISKASHPDTSASLSIFALISVLSIICNLYYFISSITDQTIGTSKNLFSIILLIGLLTNYINNVIFIFVSKYTLLQDSEFNCWRRGNVELIKEGKIDAIHPSQVNIQDHLNSELISELNDENVPKKFVTYEGVWYVILILGVCSSHNLYTLLFSHLFDLSIFKAALHSVKSLKIINYLWIVSLIANLLCLTSGAVQASQTQPTDSRFNVRVYKSVDLIFLNLTCLVFGLLLLKKKRADWQKQKSRSIGDEANSTKKVIFDHESHQVDMKNDIENQSQINGRIHNLLGSENEIGDGNIPEGSYKSSTNQEGSDLYFEKDGIQHMDDSENMQLDNNIIWMQINPDEMVPDLIEKNQGENVGEQRIFNNNSQTLITLVPEKNIETLDFNTIQPEENQETQSQGQNNQLNVQQKEQNANDAGKRSQKQKERERASQEKFNQWQIEQDQQGDQALPNMGSKSDHENKKSRSSVSKKNSKNEEQIVQPKSHSNLQRQSSLQKRLSNGYSIATSKIQLPSIFEDNEHYQNEKEQKMENKLNRYNSQKQSAKQASNIKNRFSKQEFSSNTFAKDSQAQYHQNSKETQLSKSKKNEKKISVEQQKLSQLMMQEEYDAFQQEFKELQQSHNAQLVKPLQQQLIASINTKQIDQQIIKYCHQFEQGGEQHQTQKKQEQELVENNFSGKSPIPKMKDINKYKAESFTPKRQMAKDNNRSPRLYNNQQLLYQQNIQSSPLPTPQQIQEYLKGKKIAVHEESLKIDKVSKKSPLLNKNKQMNRYEENHDQMVKEPKCSLRKSSSAQNLRMNDYDGNQYDFHQIQEQIDEKKEQENDQKYQLNSHQKIGKEDDENSLRRSIYKSTNITKINNRLGSLDSHQTLQIRTLSKNAGLRPKTTLKNNRNSNSASKNQHESLRFQGFHLKSGQKQKQKNWKSRRLQVSSGLELGNTAKIIQRKSKIAQVKSKLQKIYLPQK